VFCRHCGTRVPDDVARCTLCGEPVGTGAAATVPATAAVAPPGPSATAGPTASAAPATAAARAYAGFWRRAFACLIDALVLFFPVATARVLLGMDATGEFAPSTPEWWLAWWFEVVLTWLYAAILFSSRARATLGYRVMDLELTNLHGGPVSFLQATWRYFASFLSLATFGIGYLVQLATPRRQTLHDLVSWTVVVRASASPPSTASAAPAWGPTR
jgi:uncharacterized RDD family membrane protein YckC